MAGTVDNFNVLATALGPGKIYADLGGATGIVGPNGAWDKGANIRLLLNSDGSPDALQNPNAKHLGLTEAGCDFMVKPTYSQFFADEFIDPIITKATAEEAAISGSIQQILDMDVQEILNPTMLRRDINNTRGLTFGGSGIVAYTSVAVVFPLQDDPTKFGVFHLYKAANDAGLAAKITQKSLAGQPFAFRGYAIPTRAAGDRVGEIFYQTSVGS